MPGFTLKLTGVEDVLKSLNVTEIKFDIRAEMDNFGKAVVREAVDLAPVDESFLKQQIKWNPVNEGNNIGVEIVCNCDYAAYMEFGTRKYAAKYIAALPAEWKTFAAKYRGKGSGGSFDEFVQNIMAWVHRKKFAAHTTKGGGTSGSKASLAAEQQAAYWIALNIIQNGVKPHPFLFPAINNHNYRDLIERLKNLFK